MKNQKLRRAKFAALATVAIVGSTAGAFQSSAKKDAGKWLVVPNDSGGNNCLPGGTENCPGYD